MFGASKFQKKIYEMGRTCMDVLINFCCMSHVVVGFRCPLLLDMDVLLFVKHFIRLELPALALSCSQLLPVDEHRQQQVKTEGSEGAMVSLQGFWWMRWLL